MKPLRPTPRQLEVLQAYWELETCKDTAKHLGICVERVYQHLTNLKNRLGLKQWGPYSSIPLFKWGVRTGILSLLIAMPLIARPHRKPPPPPAPTAKAVVSWNPVPDAVAYNLQWYGDVGTTGTIFTFFTSDTIIDLPTNTVFTFAVRASGSNGYWGPFSTVTCTSGSPGVTNACP